MQVAAEAVDQSGSPPDSSADSAPSSLQFEEIESPTPTAAALTCDPQKFTKYYQLGVAGLLQEKTDEPSDDEPPKMNVMKQCDEDEDVGTFDPSKRRPSDDENDIQPPLLPNNPRTSHTQDCQVPRGCRHGYLNPFSLAHELVSSFHDSKEPLPESWDVESEPLPEYHSPPVDDFPPTFSHLTPRIRVIRTQVETQTGGRCCLLQ